MLVHGASEETGSHLIPKTGPDLPIGFSVVVSLESTCTRTLSTTGRRGLLPGAAPRTDALQPSASGGLYFPRLQPAGAVEFSMRSARLAPRGAGCLEFE